MRPQSESPMSAHQANPFIAALATPRSRRALFRALGSGITATALCGIGMRRPSLVHAQAQAATAPIRLGIESNGARIVAQQTPRGPALLVYDTAQGLLS